MVVGESRIELEGDDVRIWRDGVVIATGRWRSGRVADRSGPEADTIAWAAIEAAVERESAAFVEASSAAAYDARGVDVTQIDAMLALSPRERLRMLEVQARSLARLIGHGKTD